MLEVVIFYLEWVSLGTYLALTGRVMNGLDSMYTGIGTHFIENDNIELILN